MTPDEASEFTKTDAHPPTYAHAPTIRGNGVASSINRRLAAVLIGQKANRGVGGDGAILVAQDIFSIRICARPLQGTSASEVAAALERIMHTAGTPRETNTDDAFEWTGMFA